MRIGFLVLLAAFSSTPIVIADDSVPLKITKKEYLSQPGLDVLVFSNWYNGLFSDSKISGVELVHHGVRTVTNGDVGLHDTPEQWDAIPSFIKRDVNTENGSIEAFLHDLDYNFNHSIKVSPTLKSSLWCESL